MKEKEEACESEAPERKPPEYRADILCSVNYFNIPEDFVQYHVAHVEFSESNDVSAVATAFYLSKKDRRASSFACRTGRKLQPTTHGDNRCTA